MSGAACELVARCFAARTIAHYAHLTTGSFAQHVALGDFYDAVATAADEFFECWQSIHGKQQPDAFPPMRLAAGDIVSQLMALHTWIADNREEACENYEDTDDADDAKKEGAGCTELANLIDNILAVVDRTIYKLRYLK